MKFLKFTFLITGLCALSFFSEVKGQVILYDNTNYGGSSVSFMDNDAAIDLNSFGLNKKVSSFRISPGLQITLYNETGGSKTYTSSDNDIDDWSDKATSIRVERNSPFRLNNGEPIILKNSKNQHSNILTWNNNNKLYLQNNNGILFTDISNSKKYMSILNNGNVGIGYINPTRKLQVNGTGYFRGKVTIDGNVGIGTTNPTRKLDVNGAGYFNGGITMDRGTLYINNNTNEGTSHLLTAAKKLYIQNSEGITLGKIGAVSGYVNILKNGNVGIGTANPTTKLDVNGIVHAKRVRLDIGTFPDYVFADDYDLMPLEGVEAYIEENKHLPNMPSEAEVVANGMDVGQINTILVEKVERIDFAHH